jgi:dTDP-4-dehydrorhamnose reductase
MAELPLLITGGNGQIGGALCALAAQTQTTFVAPMRQELDLGSENALIDYINSRRWRAVINCAAYTAVDKAETDVELAFKINAKAPEILAREAAIAGIPIIHVSTDYVFDGKKDNPYDEEDVINPLGVYGRSKADGEFALRAANPHHAIIRTAWVLSAGNANFLNTMVSRGSTLPEMRVVNDQFGCPSSATDIAAAIMLVAKKLGDRHGVWHFVNSGEASWFDLATYIFAAMKKRGMKSPKLSAISTTDYPTPAARPANSRLSTKKFENDFNFKPRQWSLAVDDILAERLNEK